jgi:uncharacterized protein
MLDQLWQIAVETVTAPNFWLFFCIGLIAQIFDGALGMGFGVISSTTLTALGYPRAAVSGAVNGAKIFTGLFSGAAHIYYRNIDWKLFTRLSLGGLIGAIPGAFLVANAKGLWIGLLMSSYLILVGIFIIHRSYKPHNQHTTPARTFGVGVAGGFLESISGVWGPLVTSTMVAMGSTPRTVIGTASLSEFVVAIFVFAILVHHIELGTIGISVIALALGAFVAAPLAAKLVTEVPRRTLMMGVGILVIVTSTIRIARDVAPLLGWM